MSRLTGKAHEEEILDFLRKEGEPAYGYEIVGALAEYGAATPAEHRVTRRTLGRLVKAGRLVEDRETDANGLPIFLLPEEVR